MQLSDSIKEKIKAWEGCRLSAYRCPAGVWTIGYGHTGADVKPGMKISQARADELFDADIDAFARLVEAEVRGIALTGCQFDALVSLAYNIGVGNLRRSTLLRMVKADPANPAIAAEFRKWDKAGGAVLPGLSRRREAEANHYFGKL